jgi:hypothetical protein
MTEVWWRYVFNIFKMYKYVDQCKLGKLANLLIQARKFTLSK